MGRVALVVGESGTGKSSSLRNFEPSEIGIINCDNKELPFRDKGFTQIHAVKPTDVIKALDTLSKQYKTIVIDDAQFISVDTMFANAMDKTYDKWTILAKDLWDLIQHCKDSLPNDVYVYFLNHGETADNGFFKAKTMGKMISNSFGLESKFTIVMRTMNVDGNYYFKVHSDGSDTVKTPIGMFDTDLIENDLKYANDLIRNYYGYSDDKPTTEVAKANFVPSERKRKTQITMVSSTGDAPATEPTEVTAAAPRKRRERKKVGDPINLEAPYEVVDPAV